MSGHTSFSPKLRRVTKRKRIEKIEIGERPILFIDVIINFCLETDEKGFHFSNVLISTKLLCNNLFLVGIFMEKTFSVYESLTFVQRFLENFNSHAQNY